MANIILIIIDAYVGLLTVGDYFVNNIPNSYLLTKSGTAIYEIDNEKQLYAINTNKVLDIYPVFSLQNNLDIKGGNGNINNPYVVGE